MQHFHQTQMLILRRGVSSLSRINCKDCKYGGKAFGIFARRGYVFCGNYKVQEQIKKDNDTCKLAKEDKDGREDIFRR